MENRVLFNLLKEVGNSERQEIPTHLLKVINKSALLLSKEIMEKLNSLSDMCIEKQKAGIQGFDGTISFDFKLATGENLFININSANLEYGFSIQLENNDELMRVNEVFKFAKSRYFSTITKTMLCNSKIEISSKYEVSLRQLNSRDFMDYTIFVLNRALELLAALRSENRVALTSNS